MPLCFVVRVSPEEYDMVLVLDEDMLGRMKRADPATIEPKALMPPDVTNKLRLRTLYNCYEDASGLAKLQEMIVRGDLGGALSFLTRGIEFRPDLGDGEAPVVLQ